MKMKHLNEDFLFLGTGCSIILLLIGLPAGLCWGLYKIVELIVLNK